MIGWILYFDLFFPQTRRKNVLKDFVSVAGSLGVSHFISFSRSDANINMVSMLNEQISFHINPNV